MTKFGFKKKGMKKETVYNCYVLTVDRKLLGIVDIKELLIAERDELVKDIMDVNVVKADTLEVVAKIENINEDNENFTVSEIFLNEDKVVLLFLV